MSLKYPRWPKDEYDCLDPKLEGVLAMHERIERERQIDEITDRLHAIAREPVAGNDLKKLIEDRVLEWLDRPTNQAERHACLRGSAERFRQAMQKEAVHGSGIAAGYVAEAVQELSAIYGGFAVDRFRKDFADVFAEELAKSEPVSQRALPLRGKRQSLVTVIENQWTAAEVRLFFRFVPQVWRDLSVKTLGELEMMERILRAFLADWRERSRGFGEPVTVNGVSIRSLPRKYRSVWQSLHESVGIKVGTARYLPIHSTEPEEREPLPRDAMVPDMFQPPAEGEVAEPVGAAGE